MPICLEMAQLLSSIHTTGRLPMRIITVFPRAGVCDYLSAGNEATPEIISTRTIMLHTNERDRARMPFARFHACTHNSRGMLMQFSGADTLLETLYFALGRHYTTPLISA